MHRPLTVVLVVATVMPGCIRPPTVTLVDRRTALEEQAAGEFGDAEARMAREGTAVSPAAVTRARLEEAGQGATSGSFDTVTRIHASLRADGDLIDDLLVRRCLGEAADGTVVETPDTCVGTMDSSQVGPIVARINRDRRQLWTWMAAQRPGTAGDAARDAWRRRHLEALPCGAQVQSADGRWEVKRCDG